MTIEIELTKEDIINFNMIQQQRKHAQNRPRFWKNVGIWFIIGIIIVFVSTLLPRNINMVIHSFFPIITIVGVLATLLVIFWQPLVKSQLQHSITDRFSGVGKFLYSLSETGLHETSANSEGVTKWAGIVELVKSTEYILLYTAANAAFIFPIRCFQTVEEIQHFTNQIAQWTHLEMITLD